MTLIGLLILAGLFLGFLHWRVRRRVRRLARIRRRLQARYNERG